MLVHETIAVAEEFYASPLTIRLFGPFEVRLHGQPLPRLRTRKGQWLLALLTLRHGRGAGGPLPVERSWLAGTLWPDSSEAAAFASLRNSLKNLRRALGSEAGRLRSPTSRTLSMHLESADVDLLVFDQAISRGDEAALERAVSLYRGPLLEGCAEEWVLLERQAREQACLTALETLAAKALSRRDPAAAEPWLRRAVALDPLRESAQRSLIQALAAGGNTAAATQVYRQLRLLLHRELNAAPDPETQALYQQLRAEAREKEGCRVSGVGDRVSGKASGSFHAQRPATALVPTRHPTPDTRHPAPSEATLTFLFTDIEGSTELWERHPEAMKTALEHHDLLLRQSIQAHGGLVFKTVGDAFYAAFATAPAAIDAALSAQQALGSEAWGETGPLCVRMALHTGIAQEREGDYFGPTLNRVARLLEAGHGGQVLLTLPTEELARDELPEGTNVRHLGEHRLKDLVRPEQVYQLVHPDLPATFPPLRSLEAFANNLPVQLTSFVGREREMAEVQRLLAGTHLLTLTGAGGCGKTRLALQIAADLVAAYRDGVWLVELAALSEPGLVPQTVASTLGVREQPGPTFGVCPPLAATLADHLRARALLLVLDNCEHLLSACAGLVETLLRSCAGLRILATSREGLHIAGETTFRVPPLSLPDPQQLPPADMLTQFEAANLFVDRAIAALPSFTLTDQNAAAVAQVCLWLDGMPLAIELAAARVKALAVETMAERFDDRFRLLTGGSRTALPRQQTLRALIDWSYDLLDERERVLLRRLSVFAGGWTLEAAEAVCSNVEGRMQNAELGKESSSSILHSTFCLLHSDDVLDLLTSLVEKSLVVYEEPGTHAEHGAGEARYRLLETIRQYAGERLRESGEEEAARGRHRDWYLGLAERAEPELEGAHQEEWLKRLEAEHGNLRGALEWGWASESVSALRLAGALGRFWQVRGHLSEGREALERGGEAPAEVRRKALDWAGWLAYLQGEPERAKALSEASLALSRELGDKQGIARTLTTLGSMARSQGDYPAARAAFEECLAISRQIGSRDRLAHALLGLGYVACEEGNDAAACSTLEESLAIWRALGNKVAIAWSLDALGRVARGQGDGEAAQARHEASLAIWREIGDKLGMAGRCKGWPVGPRPRESMGGRVPCCRRA